MLKYVHNSSRHNKSCNNQILPLLISLKGTSNPPDSCEISKKVGHQVPTCSIISILLDTKQADCGGMKTSPLARLSNFHAEAESLRVY
ncbi:hypothetical protein Nepgr_008745 [Nepenthes gracilis]|uniref:Uncharacterized protein n=1 Tax=Nepenthes gracilis TaxID=150966 RepID=A0AAD3S987_NEPGR|nr:hypothetical protein Nepgr_008745 [Nepenthes gracilis]